MPSNFHKRNREVYQRLKKSLGRYPSQVELANILGVSRERARQIVNILKLKMLPRSKIVSIRAEVRFKKAYEELSKEHPTNSYELSQRLGMHINGVGDQARKYHLELRNRFKKYHHREAFVIAYKKAKKELRRNPSGAEMARRTKYDHSGNMMALTTLSIRIANELNLPLSNGARLSPPDRGK